MTETPLRGENNANSLFIHTKGDAMKRYCRYKYLTGAMPGYEYCRDSCEDCFFFLTDEEVINIIEKIKLSRAEERKENDCKGIV